MRRELDLEMQQQSVKLGEAREVPIQVQLAPSKRLVMANHMWILPNSQELNHLQLSYDPYHDCGCGCGCPFDCEDVQNASQKPRVAPHCGCGCGT